MEHLQQIFNITQETQKQIEKIITDFDNKLNTIENSTEYDYFKQKQFSFISNLIKQLENANYNIIETIKHFLRVEHKK